MKKIFLFLCMISHFALFGQEINNFLLNGNDIVWQKVYEEDISIESLKDRVISTGKAKHIKIDDNTISGVLEDVVLDYGGYGKSELFTPMYIARSLINGGFNVEVREGRYRVTITNVMLVQRYGDGGREQEEKTPLNHHAVNRKGEVKRAFTKLPSEIINFSFDKLFKHQDIELSDDW